MTYARGLMSIHDKRDAARHCIPFFFNGTKPKRTCETGYNGRACAVRDIRDSYPKKKVAKSVIREMIDRDAERVLEIYALGLETRNATFETQVPAWADWDAKHHAHSRFVFVEDEKVLGWIVLAPTSARQVYAGVAEVSVYVDTRAHGQGIGSALMEKVIASSEAHGIWTLYSSVFAENIATVKLHEKFGFRVIGRREKIAKLDGVWRDTVLLERRSKVVGVD